MTRRVLDVGNCDYDHGAIRALIQRHCTAEVVRAHRQADALEKLKEGPFDLVLVNRVFDEDGSEGLDLIRAMKADNDLTQVPVMLLTNYAEHQQQAALEGAVVGFGKGALKDPQTWDQLHPYLSE